MLDYASWSCMETKKVENNDDTGESECGEMRWESFNNQRQEGSKKLQDR